RSPPTNAVPTITTARTSPNRSAVHASTSPPETPIVAAATTHERRIGLTSFLIVVVRRPQRPVHQRHRHAYGGDDDARPHGQRRLRREGEQEQHAADGHPQPAEPGAGGAGHWGLRGWVGMAPAVNGMYTLDQSKSDVYFAGPQPAQKPALAVAACRIAPLDS